MAPIREVITIRIHPLVFEKHSTTRNEVASIKGNHNTSKNLERAKPAYSQYHSMRKDRVMNNAIRTRYLTSFLSFDRTSIYIMNPEKAIGSMNNRTFRDTPPEVSGNTVIDSIRYRDGLTVSVNSPVNISVSSSGIKWTGEALNLVFMASSITHPAIEVYRSTVSPALGAEDSKPSSLDAHLLSHSQFSASP
jgi:hypothetical protein